MAQQETIKDFLVSLSFKADQPALKKFSEGISGATKAVERLAGIVAGAAVAISVGIERFASNLENLYFSANRVGSTVSNIKAFQLASQNLGATAAEAQGSLEGLAQALRVNPANEGLLKGLGVQTRDAKGNLRDMTAIVADLGKRLAGMPIFVAEQWAAQLGIGEHELLAIMNPDFASQLSQAQQQLQSMGFDKAAEDAHRFETQMRQLELVIQVFGAQVLDALQNKLGLSLKSLTTWIQTNGPALAARLVDAVNEIAGVVVALAKPLNWLGQEFIWLDKVTDGWSTKVLGLLGALRLLGGASAVGLLARAGVAVGGAALGAPAAAVGAGAALGYGLDKLFPNNPLARFGRDIGAQWSEHANKIPNMVQLLRSLGLSPNAAVGVTANLQAESGLYPNLTGDHGAAYGVAQWHGNYQRQFQDLLGKPMQQSSLFEQVAFLLHTLEDNPTLLAQLQGARSPAAAAQLFSSQYERPSGGAVEAARRGQLATSIAQTVNVHIDGSKSPEATGRAVVTAVQRAQASVTRNLVSVVQ